MSGVPGFTSAALNRARLSRDPRFDGKFFIAVLSTGIYCRPICPGPRCRRSNVAFYPTAAAAEAAGYRPCRRCRPEAAPGSAAWLGPSAVVRRALRLIQDGTLDDGTVEDLAMRVGLGARQLSRLFVKHVGTSPIAVALTRRLQFSRQLIDETSLPITEIAMAAGFRSLRRFNEAYREAFNCPPRESRRRQRSGTPLTSADQVVLTLPYHPPYDWQGLCTFLQQRVVAGVECVDARGYARTLRLEHGHALIRAAPIDSAHALRLEVARASPRYLFEIAGAARRMFDLSADPIQINSVLAGDALLAHAVGERPGLRIPGVWDAFECAVRVVLGENVDRTAAAKVLERLVHRCGDPLEEPYDGLTHLFPSPARLANANLDGIGLTNGRIEALRALARASLSGGVDFMEPADAVAKALAALSDVSREGAQYVVWRGLGEPDAFPLTEQVVQRLFDTPQCLPSDEAIEERTQSWRPWRGYAVLHLSPGTELEARRRSRPSKTLHSGTRPLRGYPIS